MSISNRKSFVSKPSSWSRGVRYTLSLCFTIAILLLITGLAGQGLRRNVVQDGGAGIDAEQAAEFRRVRQSVLDYENPPDFRVEVDYAEGAAAAWWPKGESPILAAMVERGELPPVEERVGPEPVVFRGFAGIGHYGGDWWRLAADIDDIRLVLGYQLASGEALVRPGPYGENYRTQLAGKVEHNDDYTLWTVHLRRGVKWSDGVPVTAGDVAWWWEQVQAPNMREMNVVDEYGTEIEVVNAHTLRYRFTKPHPGFRWGAEVSVVPMHYLEPFHPERGNQELIQTIRAREHLTSDQLLQRKNHVLNPERPTLAPWMFRTASSNGPWTLVRNPYYYAVDEQGNQLPYIDRIVFRQISGQLQGKAISDGLTSFSAVPEGMDYASLMSGREGGNYVVRHWATERRGEITVYPNRNKAFYAESPVEQAKGELLARREFRKALSIAINRQTIIDAELKGVGRPAQLGPGPGVPWHDPELLQAHAEYAPEQANEILDSLGLDRRDQDGFRLLPDGTRLTMTMIVRPGGTGPYLFMVQDWAAVGLRVILREQPHRLFLRAQDRADLVGGGVASERVWRALGAGTPYSSWYFTGGLAGTEDSKNPLFPQPGELEIEAIRAGEFAGITLDPNVRFTAARRVMQIAGEQIWTLNVATAQPDLFVVKEGLRGVPELLLASFSLGTPFNANPETWYWENPDTLNGDRQVSAEYLRNRDRSITRELLTVTLDPGGAHPAEAGDEAGGRGGADMLGNLFKWLLIGIVLCGIGLLGLRHPFVWRRLVLMIPTLVTISIIVYFGVQLPEGSYLDTVMVNLEGQGMRPEQALAEISELREMYHLDDSAVKNYFRWTGLLWFVTWEDTDKGLLQGNMGRSMSNDGAFVNDLVGDRLLLSFCISLGSILFTWLVAIPIGVYSAVRQYSVADYVLTIGGFLGMCIPNFILALVLMLIGKELFGVTVMGLFSPRYAMQDYWDWGKLVDLLKHIWLPLVVVGTASTAGMIRVMRANLLDELKKPYVTTAKAKGVRPLKLLFKYPFRLALNPFISGIGGIFPALISGSAIVAIILSLPTVGPLLLDAVRLEDTYMAGSLLLLLSALSVFGVLVSDLLLMLLDPRIRMEGRGK